MDMGIGRSRPTRVWFAVASCPFVFFLASCQPPTAQPLDESDLSAIRQMTDDWLVAHASRDWDAVGLQYTEQAVLMPPMAPAIRGRMAIQAWFETNENDTRVEIAILEIEGFADLAYVRGESRVTLGVTTDAPITFVGKYLDIRRRQPDGSWRVSVDMFSPDRELN